MIVGGASGFGRATAEALAKRGASVAVLDRPQSKDKRWPTRSAGNVLSGRRHRLRGHRAGLAAGRRCTRRAAHRGDHRGRRTGERTVKKDGPHSLDSFRFSVDLNLIGTFNVSRLAAWHMSTNEPEDEERGLIINTSSIAAFEGQIGQVRLHRVQGRDRRDVPDDGA